jgi:hypothetical protein
MSSENFGLHAIVKLMSGQICVINTWNGFNMGNLLRKITEIMETEHGENDFNCDRILFFDKGYERIDFMDDDLLNNGDYFNVVIVDEEDVAYVHGGYWDQKYAEQYEKEVNF